MKNSQMLPDKQKILPLLGDEPLSMAVQLAFMVTAHQSLLHSKLQQNVNEVTTCAREVMSYLDSTMDLNSNNNPSLVEVMSCSNPNLADILQKIPLANIDTWSHIG